ncbi:bifunctional diguanylate cyclase/phosphodiesterase [Actinoplanes sp. L3-i22]|uniref:putative bifunctional diguanylate cyclase/phosphodiesterase n=1 Tax=Actinoplanes sp. L3-i22 TaxID=2836373 RepID=UPI001C7896AF|nr:EAL domain-containing protein [Actinoplanes sp. L3-i22]BCY07490.1 bifunctional diguanylate cyclase/phosphodiesterase [Actinoplanes sp. L3-i22]
MSRVPHPTRVVVAADDLAGAVAKLEQLRATGFDGVAEVLLAADAVQQAAHTTHQLQTAIDNIPAPIFSKDAGGVYGACNTAFEAYVGVSRDRIIGRTVHGIWSKDLADVYAAADRALFDAGGKQVYDAAVVYADGSRHEVTFYKGVLTDEHGAVTGLSGAMLDITERRVLERRLQELADTDPLTGAANRALFTRRVDEAVARPGDCPPAVLLIDLDDFKGINDTLGHEVGDHFLIAVTGVLRDALADGGLVARLGGDEFAVLLEDRAEARIEQVVRRVVAALARPVEAAGHPLTPRASIGVARGRADLLRHADIALYAAKDGGKSRCVHYRPGMRTRVIDHAATLTALRRALADDRLTLHYQPVVRLGDRTVTGVEALVRWTDPARGPVPPAEFLPVAERSGLIVPLGEWVLRAACRDGGQAPMTYVNVSARELRETGFADRVATALAISGLAPDRLVIEVTEAAMDDAAALAGLHRIRDLGARIALDDFGIGRASVALLAEVPVAVVKVHRSFTERITENGRHTAVARALARLADDLGIDAVAKGVETAAQARRLQEIGYRHAQGFHIGRPLPRSDHVPAGHIDPSARPGLGCPN